MQYRQLGNSGLMVPALCYGTGTFGGVGEMMSKWGNTDVAEAKELIDICLDKGINFFDTADVYSDGQSERILGEAIRHHPRDELLISTKGTFTMGQGPNDKGSSRHHLIKAVDASLKRLQTDYIDLYFLHSFDALTPQEETLSTLNDLVTAGKLRYFGCSNFSGWQVMKSLATSERYGWNRHVAYQGYYSLLHRDYEWELMPLALDQGLGTMVWSPLGWGRLTGKFRRGQMPDRGRVASGGDAGGPEVNDEHLFNIVDCIDDIAAETGYSVPQIALNWLLQRPSISSVIVGARNAEQLQHNLSAVDITLSEEQLEKLDSVSHRTPTYPYWHQRNFDSRNPKPTKW